MRGGRFDYQAVHSLDQAAIARLYEALGHTDDAAQLYERSLQGNLPPEIYQDTLARLALLHKRQGDYTSALPLWERAAQEGQLYAFEELAKYYEHHARDLTQALHWTRAALEYVQQPGFPRLERLQSQPELLHRQERLLRKLHGADEV
jgi:tetratricopeptide (TPR) repeat protein